jgi:hypothetical protein
MSPVLLVAGGWWLPAPPWSATEVLSAQNTADQRRVHVSHEVVPQNF